MEYLSPTRVNLYRRDPEEFYTRYMRPGERVHEPQLQVMSIGSAFDAYVKSYLHEKLFGKGADPKYGFEALFESQVEPQWRDWAREHGMYVFMCYKDLGALADLILDLQGAINDPKFEIEIIGAVESRSAMTGSVTLLGKPDVFYINSEGAHVIVDWKVNGYLSKGTKSPDKGYVRIRPGGQPHKNTIVDSYAGMSVNKTCNLGIDWLTQLSVYAWLSGCQVGEVYVAGIDQICCSENGTEYPDIRVAEHRTLVPSDIQESIFNLSAQMWEVIHSDHYFRDMTLEDSKSRCAMLDEVPHDVDPDFAEMARGRIQRF